MRQRATFERCDAGTRCTRGAAASHRFSDCHDSSHGNPVAGLAHSRAGRYPYTNPDTHSYANSDSHSRANPYPYANPDARSDSHTRANRYTYSNPDARSNTNADRHTHPCANAYSHTYSHADGNADARSWGLHQRGSERRWRITLA